MSKPPKNSTDLYRELKMAIGCVPPTMFVALKYDLVLHIFQHNHLPWDFKRLHYYFLKDMLMTFHC